MTFKPDEMRQNGDPDSDRVDIWTADKFEKKHQRGESWSGAIVGREQTNETSAVSVRTPAEAAAVYRFVPQARPTILSVSSSLHPQTEPPQREPLNSAVRQSLLHFFKTCCLSADRHKQADGAEFLHAYMTL